MLQIASKASILKGDLKILSNLHKPAIICTYGIGENALGIARSLGRKNIPVILVTVKGSLNVSVHSKYCSIIIEITEFSRDSILNEIVFLSQQIKDKPVLFFDNCKMVNLFHKDKELLKQYCFITQGIGDFTDKTYQFEMVANANVAVPKTWKPESWNEYNTQIITKKKLISKPDFASGKKPFKLLIADDPIQLKSQLEKYVNTPAGLLIQEYIDGDQKNVWVALGYTSPISRGTHIMTAIKYLMNPNYGGVMAIGRVIDNEEVRKASIKLLESFNYEGIFGFEFKYSPKDDCYYYIEMSPRTEGFHNITTLAGFDLPLMAYKDIYVESVGKGKSYYGSYWVNARYTVDSLIGSRSILDLLRTLKVILIAREWQQFAWDDLKPFIRGTKWYLDKLAKKVLKKIKQ
jgi:predicted ATP-grasp superfamily ATP-dependent carboligase